VHYPRTVPEVCRRLPDGPARHSSQATGELSGTAHGVFGRDTHREHTDSTRGSGHVGRPAWIVITLAALGWGTEPPAATWPQHCEAMRRSLSLVAPPSRLWATREDRRYRLCHCGCFTADVQPSCIILAVSISAEAIGCGRVRRQPERGLLCHRAVQGSSSRTRHSRVPQWSCLPLSVLHEEHAASSRGARRPFRHVLTESTSHVCMVHGEARERE
jgi:hypothetical protein